MNIRAINLTNMINDTILAVLRNSLEDTLTLLESIREEIGYGEDLSTYQKLQIMESWVFEMGISVRYDRLFYKTFLNSLFLISLRHNRDNIVGFLIEELVVKSMKYKDKFFIISIDNNSWDSLQLLIATLDDTREHLKLELVNVLTLALARNTDVALKIALEYPNIWCDDVHFLTRDLPNGSSLAMTENMSCLTYLLSSNLDEISLLFATRMAVEQFRAMPEGLPASIHPTPLEVSFDKSFPVADYLLEFVREFNPTELMTIATISCNHTIETKLKFFKLLSNHIDDLDVVQLIESNLKKNTNSYHIVQIIKYLLDTVCDITPEIIHELGEKYDRINVISTLVEHNYL
jgi:hypothetical protein